MKNRILTIVFSICLFFLIITTSIGLPIYFRFFYYAHIKAYNLESFGRTYAQIKEAYDQVLNYLTLPFTEFKVGVMTYSSEGASHFADCKKLFSLNLIVMMISFIGVMVLAILNKKKVISFTKTLGFHPAFYSAVSAIIIPIVLGALCCIDFNSAFIIFHKIFFPGKTNWQFDPSVDEIITYLPQEFFRNCAILIGVGLVIICTVILIITIKKRNKNKRVTK